jgi:hypothetical protein
MPLRQYKGIIGYQLVSEKGNCITLSLKGTKKTKVRDQFFMSRLRFFIANVNMQQCMP